MEEEQETNIMKKIESTSKETMYLSFCLLLVLVVLILAITAIVFSYNYDIVMTQLSNLTQNCIYIEPIQQGGVPEWNMTKALNLTNYLN